MRNSGGGRIPAGDPGAGLTLVWFISCLPVALPVLWPPARAMLGDTSRLALACLPWVAWIGIPGRGGRWAADLALALPPIAAGFAADAAAGRDPAGLLWTAALSMSIAALLATASSRASLGGRGGVHAVLWATLVPGAPFLLAALELGGAPALRDAPAWLAGLAGASPIAWLWREAAADPPAAMILSRTPFGALAISILLWAVARARRREVPA